MEEIIEVNNDTIELDTEIIEMDTGISELDAEILIEPEFPMYVVMDYEAPELFGFYVLLILSLLIVYPIIKAIRHAFGGVRQWK